MKQQWKERAASPSLCLFSFFFNLVLLVEELGEWSAKFSLWTRTINRFRCDESQGKSNSPVDERNNEKKSWKISMWSRTIKRFRFHQKSKKPSTLRRKKETMSWRRARRSPSRVQYEWGKPNSYVIDDSQRTPNSPEMNENKGHHIHPYKEKKNPLKGMKKNKGHHIHHKERRTPKRNETKCESWKRTTGINQSAARV